MKVSEAIRKGAGMVSGRCTGHFFEHTQEDELIAVCALGAAYIGGEVGEPRRYSNPWGELEGAFPELARMVYIKDQPKQRLEHGHYRRALEEVIYGLNDVDGWTLPQIADYVEGLGY